MIEILHLKGNVVETLIVAAMKEKDIVVKIGSLAAHKCAAIM